jgi:hypothetical protein
MDATPVCSTGWRCTTVSRLHRKCGRTFKTRNFAVKSRIKFRLKFVQDLTAKLDDVGYFSHI